MAQKLKDIFFTEESVNAFAEAIVRQYPGFNTAGFLSEVYDASWESLELKAKMRHVTHCLHQVLPGDFVESLLILVKAAPEIKGFEAMTLPDYVEVYGMKHWEESLNALGQFTRYSSSEFAIRPFLDENPELTMHYMKTWAKSEHENVRRFASEGCRPRLPWAMVLPRFVMDPMPVLEVLELLKDDESIFVRKSVANNLNDISKDHPELAMDKAVEWFGYSDRTNWIIKHGLRTLLKNGNVRALRLFGFGDPDNVDITQVQLNKKSLKIGGDVSFNFSLENRETEVCKLRLEYIIDFVKSSGKTSKKVFQILEKDFPPGTHQLKRKHSFADLTTRKHYPGKHSLSIIVNGVEKARVALDLKR